MKNLYLLLISLFIPFSVYSQNTEWINYTNGNYIVSLAEEGDYMWVGISFGLVKLNKTTGDATFYNTSNSGLPDNWVNSIAIDESGNKWIGTLGGGIAKYDGTNWSVYNTSNSGLPDNRVFSIAIDESGNKWIGTDGGLAKYDGTNWSVYDTSNSGLPENWVNSIAIDESGNKWIGTYGGGIAIFREGGIVLVEGDKAGVTEIPDNFILSQNYPNPFNPSTKIKFEIPKQTNVKLSVYDILGKEIAVLINEEKLAGNYTVEFNSEKYNLPCGIYFYRLQAGNFVETKKLVLMK